MQIQSHANDFDLTEHLRDRVAMRFAYSLNHGHDILSRIVVRQSDVNGPRGGVDKQCAIGVRPKGRTVIAINDIEDHHYAAIDRAVECTWRTLEHRIVRRHQLATHPVSQRLPRANGAATLADPGQRLLSPTTKLQTQYLQQTPQQAATLEAGQGMALMRP